MHETGGTPEPLGVDTKSLSNLGNDLVSSAGDIPDPPAPFTTTGTDPISTKIMSMQKQLETPIETGLPEVKAAAKKTAGSVVAAATKYDQADEQLAQQIKAHTFDDAGGPAVGGGLGGGAQGVVGPRHAQPMNYTNPNRVGGKIGADAPAPSGSAPGGSPGAESPGSGSGAPSSGAGGGAAPAAAASAAGTPAAGAAKSAAGGAASSASSGADIMGQMGQFISMPMQMVGQAAGMATSVPQTVMQGVESAVQQVSQVTGGQDGGSSPDKTELTGEHRPDESAKAGEAQQGAASGQSHGSEPAPVPPVEKPPAPTRPTEVADRMNL